MSIINGHCPLPNSFITKINKLRLTHREYRLLMTIGTEIYRFPEGRESLSKELAGRYLESLTGIKQNHISRMLNNFKSRGYIKMIKSHIKGQGSIIILTLDTTTGSNNSDTAIVSNNTQLDTATVSNPAKSDTATGSNPINLSKKESDQESDILPTPSPDDILYIDKREEEKQPEKKTLETSSNCSNLIKDNQQSSKISNQEESAINLLRPAGLGVTDTIESEFSSIGSVLSGIMPVPQVSVLSDKKTFPTSSKSIDNTHSLSENTIQEGKAILRQKGFSPSEIIVIIDRITVAMTGKDIKNNNKYFIASCSKETKKISNNASSIHKATGAALPQPIKPTKKTECLSWEKEISSEELLNKIQFIKPTELWEVISDVNNNSKLQKSLSFFESDEMKKHVLINHYITEFKKRYPEVVI